MVYDLLIGSKRISGGGAVKNAVVGLEQELQAELAKMKSEAKVEQVEQLLPAQMQSSVVCPKYGRVNKCRTTTDALRKQLEDSEFKFVSPAMPLNEFVTSNDGRIFQLDSVIPHLFVFHPKAQIATHPAVKSHQLILQDRSSCLPAFILSSTVPPRTVLDACAAPGNKTSHLASLLPHTKLLATERDQKRCELLMRRLKDMRCDVRVCQRDFLTVKWTEELFSDVTHILLDPSCSGSGMFARPDTWHSSCSAGRVQQLAKLQLKMVNHALSCPSLQFLSYSTCSIHKEENEEVVAQALAANPGFSLITVCPQWPTRGVVVDSLPDAAKCVRCDPSSDFTSGFFVALFARKPVDDKRKADYSVGEFAVKRAKIDTRSRFPIVREPLFC